jgi:hypothetical protein
LKRFVGLINGLDAKLDRLQEMVGRIEAARSTSMQVSQLRDAEFRVYSQWGEDGIIQHLIGAVPIARPIFVEFGVQDYREANTRFLLVNNNWSGLVLDGSPDNIAAIRRDDIYWRHNLRADCAFITRDNINELLSRNGLAGDIGLLSVDIDGNDYWVWQAIDVVSPRIVVAEYNSRFGAERAVTVPYDPEFIRGNAHFSMIYYGASLAALVALGARKGYDFVGSNSAGNNAFFVRRDLRPAALPVRTSAEGYVRAQFREARDQSGRLLFASFEEEQRMLEKLPLEEVPA